MYKMFGSLQQKKNLLIEKKRLNCSFMIIYCEKKASATTIKKERKKTPQKKTMEIEIKQKHFYWHQKFMFFSFDIVNWFEWRY